MMFDNEVWEVSAKLGYPDRITHCETMYVIADSVENAIEAVKQELPDPVISIDGVVKKSRPYATIADTAPIKFPPEPTNAQLADICTSLRHDFDLLDATEREEEMRKMRECWIAVWKTMN